MADPDLLTDQGWWTTPVDVVRALQRSPLLAGVEALPSSRWMVEALDTQLPRAASRAIRQAVAAGQLPTLPGDDARGALLALEFARAWADYSQQRGTLPRDTAAAVLGAADHLLRTRFAEQGLDLADYKNPLRRPQDSQWRAGWEQRPGGGRVVLGLLAASHRLEDDNRQGFGESALQLGDLTVSVDPQRGQAAVEAFDVYAMTSLTPANQPTGGLTARVRLGLARQDDARLHPQAAVVAGGGMGLSLRLAPDVLTYGLVSGGLGATEGASYLFGDPEVGLVVHEIARMKSWLTAGWLLNPLGQGGTVRTLSWTQTKALGEHQQLFASLSRRELGGASETRWLLGLKTYF